MLADFIYPFIKKILPWTLLLMCIAFGVAIITGGTINVSETGQIGDSYLYQLTNGSITYYKFNMQDYINGLSMSDIFNRWQEIGDNFKATWVDMQNQIDFDKKPFQSLANSFILIPNMLSNLINTLILLPLQLISQLLTVIFRVLGQQVNQNSTFWLGKILYNINTWSGIPQIPYIAI